MLKPKILFILLNPLPSTNAAWARVEFLVNYLKGCNYDVAVAGAFSAKALSHAGSIEYAGIKILNLVPVIGLTHPLSLIFNIVSSFIVSFFLFLAIRPRLVIISLPAGGNTLGCFLMAKLFKSKIITDYRDEWEDYIYNMANNRFSRALMNNLKYAMTKCYVRSDAVITVTEPLAKSLRKRGVKNVRIISNGADLTVFKPKDRTTSRTKIGIPSDTFVLVYIGFIGAYYRFDIVLYALKKIIDNNGDSTKIKLLIAGHGTSLNLVLELAENIGLKDNVLYLGKIIKKDELVDILCASDVGIIPYDSNPLWRNSLPVKSLEYLACGLPIVAMAHDDSLLGKMIIENELGLVVQPENINSFYDAVSRIRKNNELRTTASMESVSIIQKNFDRHKIALEFSAILLRCLSNEH